MASEYEDQLYAARLFALNRNLQPIVANCSVEFYFGLVQEIDQMKLHFYTPIDGPARLQMHGLFIDQTDTPSRFWLQCKDTLYAVVPDGLDGWKVDSAMQWVLRQRQATMAIDAAQPAADADRTGDA